MSMIKLGVLEEKERLLGQAYLCQMKAKRVRLKNPMQAIRLQNKAIELKQRANGILKEHFNTRLNLL